MLSAMSCGDRLLSAATRYRVRWQIELEWQESLAICSMVWPAWLPSSQTHHAKYMTLLESAWTVMALAMAAGALSSLPPDR